ncbi:ABC transporter permease subunit [Cardiobacteriaceae bacterium TAE3-ERU3]|nr:ABC transporter permease subunit [Cardiobacteriaceae bacterium TAE3-ERU3]
MRHIDRIPLRFQLAQIVVATTIVLFGAWIYHNVSGNLARLGQGISFGFLDDPANFPVSQSLIDYSARDSYLRVFWVGLLNTLLVSGLTVITATIIGVVAGVMRISPNWLLRKIAAVFVEAFRNVPLLLQLFFWYFAILPALPPPRTSEAIWGCQDGAGCLLALTNRGLYAAKPTDSTLTQLCLLILTAAMITAILLIRYARRKQIRTGKTTLVWPWIVLLLITPFALWFGFAGADDFVRPELKGFNYRGGFLILPELAALWLALTLYSAAYIAEYVRGGIQSVAKGQYEAAASIGLGNARAMQLVILPQALRVIIPPLTNQYLNIVKNSSLATAIAYPDLVSVFTGTALNQTGRAIEIITMTMAVYLFISLTIALFMNLYNRRIQLVTR